MAKKRKLENKSTTESTSTVEEQQQQLGEEEEKTQFDEGVEEHLEEEEDDVEALDGINGSNSNFVSADASTVTESAPATINGDEDAGDDEDDEDDEDEPVQKLLEPFTKDQLVDLLRDAANKYQDVFDCIQKIADVDPVHRKIFVHGLGWDTNAETLISVFKKYGEIEDCKAVCDKISGKSKGYGFILFKHRNGARKALKQPQKRIGSRMTACQLASAGPVPPTASVAPAAPPVSEYTQRKIYVSNVSADIDPQKLLTFFAKYGEIAEGPLGLDKQTGKPKGFTLFVYKSAESAKKALEEPHKNYEGHILHCQKAIDGPKPNKSFYHPHQSNHTSGGGHGSHFPRNENPSFPRGMGSHVSAAEVGGGHMMAPSAAAGVSFNQGAAQLNPVLGQALTALLASQGGGLGLTNLLGTLGSTGMVAPGNQSVPSGVTHGIQGAYGNQPVGSNISPNMMGGYGNQPGMQGGYANPQMGQTSTGRTQQGAGHMGGVAPYMGH